MPQSVSLFPIGYVKYEGLLVADGIIDAGVAATALRGVDSALRYFVTQARPDLAAAEFPIPVRIERGSWSVTLPDTLVQWIATAGGIGLTAYLAAAGTKLGENDFRDASLRKVFAKALLCLIWFVRISKHLGVAAGKSWKNLRWRDNNSLAEIENDEGSWLAVPKDAFIPCVDAPSGLIADLARIIVEGRTLTIGKREGSLNDEVTVNETEKRIFFVEDKDDEPLFPELKHGDRVELDGVVTRGNETANSIGFKYQNHILTCRPIRGSIVRYKPHLFLRCSIKGVISRDDDRTGDEEARKPKIHFDELRLLAPESEDPTLF